MSRKHTVNVFRDLPDMIYKMLSQVSTMRERMDAEIVAMKLRELVPPQAHHLMVEAIRANVLPASRLPKVIEAWEEPQHEAFQPRTAWSLFNAFTEVQKINAPRALMEGSLRLSALFRSANASCIGSSQASMTLGSRDAGRMFARIASTIR